MEALDSKEWNEFIWSKKHSHRVKYKDVDGKERTYFPDFIDYINKIVYEIKPDHMKKYGNYELKKLAAVNWCNKRNFTFIHLGTKWFELNSKMIDIEKYIVKKIKTEDV